MLPNNKVERFRTFCISLYSMLAEAAFSLFNVSSGIKLPASDSASASSSSTAAIVVDVVVVVVLLGNE